MAAGSSSDWRPTFLDCSGSGHSCLLRQVQFPRSCPARHASIPPLFLHIPLSSCRLLLPHPSRDPSDSIIPPGSLEALASSRYPNGPPLTGGCDKTDPRIPPPADGYFTSCLAHHPNAPVSCLGIFSLLPFHFLSIPLLPRPEAAATGHHQHHRLLSLCFRTLILSVPRTYKFQTRHREEERFFIRHISISPLCSLSSVLHQTIDRLLFDKCSELLLCRRRKIIHKVEEPCL